MRKTANRKPITVIIMGAAGRDFHNFNVLFRNNPIYEVVAFTATQIPNIEHRKYPSELAGQKLYPQGIPIYPEDELKNLIQKHKVELVVFAYSDVSHEYVMRRASIALSCGANFILLGPKYTMLKSNKPVIAIGAVRTGCGKSQTTRKVVKILQELAKKVVVVRHPMAYGNLIYQEIQRIERNTDLTQCTIEEREEYEPYIRMQTIVYAGVDYGKILSLAEKEADIIVWDGGNNDFPFYEPDLFIVVVDPLRAGDELKYHPGETCLRMAQVVIINKIDSARKDDVMSVKHAVSSTNPSAHIIEANSAIELVGANPIELVGANPCVRQLFWDRHLSLPLQVTLAKEIKDKAVLVVEDGPSLTHGGMGYGAGFVAAKRFGARVIVDPRPYAVGSIAKVYEKYPSIQNVLPAMGYNKEQLRELELTINNSKADIVIGATPIDLSQILSMNKPYVRVNYELEEIGAFNLKEILVKWINDGMKRSRGEPVCSPCERQ